MANRWTFGKQVGAGFAFAGVVVLVIGIAGFYTTDQLIENDRKVSHTQLVQRTLASLLSELKDVETGHRGYVITGDKAFLEPHLSAIEKIPQTLIHLKELISDNDEQVRRVEQLIPLIEDRIEMSKKVVVQREAEGFEATAKVVGSGDGKAVMNSIRGLVGEMDRVESRLLATRNATAESTAYWTKVIIASGSLVGLALIALCGWLITSSLTRQIGSAVQHIRSSSSELQAAAAQQTSGSREQATAMNEIATTIKELVATARQIAESAQRVASIAEGSADGARAGDQTMQRAQEALANIKRQVDSIVTHMIELGRKSQQIGGILDVINELAEQTNILSINASIEAAGAGDMGRRFGVVADEIRKLADRVGGSTKEIKGLVEEIRSAVHTTVMATESGSKAVDSGTRQFGDVSQSFRQILQQVETTTEAAREIELSTKQQTTAVDQVNEAIANVAQASRETEVSSTQTLQTVTELTSLSRELERLVQPQAMA